MSKQKKEDEFCLSNKELKKLKPIGDEITNKHISNSKVDYENFDMEEVGKKIFDALDDKTKTKLDEKINDALNKQKEKRK